jgi:hypothetical protein
MAKAIQIGALPSSATVTTANTTQYWQLNGSTTTTTTEANAQMKVYTAGTYSTLRVRITSNSVAAVSHFNFRINGADGNQTVPTISSTSGIYSDGTNTDAVTAGDLINISSVPGGSTGTMGLVMIAVAFDTGGSSTVSRMVYGCTTGFNGAITTGATTFFPLMGNIVFNNTAPSVESTCQVLQRVSGTFQNLSIKLNTSSRAVTDTFKFRKNGADGNMTVPITASTTGSFQDTVNTDTVTAGDLVCYTLVNGAASTGRTIGYFSSEFVTTTNPGTGQLSCGIPSSTALSIATGQSNWLAIGGNATKITTEVNTQVQVYDAYTFHDLSINVPVNPLTGASSLSLRQNGSTSVLSAPITGSTTGWFTDPTHTVTTTTGDELNLQLTAGTGTGSLTYACTSLFADIAGAGGGSVTCTVTGKTVTNKFITKI